MLEHAATGLREMSNGNEMPGKAREIHCVEQIKAIIL
jgi:hypothetical protein